MNDEKRGLNNEIVQNFDSCQSKKKTGDQDQFYNWQNYSKNDFIIISFSVFVNFNNRVCVTNALGYRRTILQDDLNN